MGDIYLIEMIIILAIGLIGGIAVGTQAPIASAMSMRIGAAAGTVVVHLGGLVASLILLLGSGEVRIAEWRDLPWYMLACGAFGVVLFLSISYTIPKIGATAAITLVVLGQLLAGLVIDHFGVFGVDVKPIDLPRMLAAGLLLAGAYLMVR